LKLIITGATGFIGSHLCRRLQGEGWGFSCLVRSKAAVKSLADKDIKAIDISNNSPSLYEILKQEAPTGIVHLASYYTRDHREKEIGRLVESNIHFGTQIIDAAVKAGVSWFLNTGTFWQHYNGAQYDPVNLYAATKQAFEDIGRYYVNAHGLRFCTIKLCDTYGAGDNRRKIYSLWEEIAKSGEMLDMSPGNQLIDIIHIDRAIDAFAKLIKALDSGLMCVESCDCYYVSSNRRISLKELAQEYELMNNVHLNINWGGRNYQHREVMTPACSGKPIEDLYNYLE